MLNLTLQILIVIGFLGIFLIMARKIPILSQMPIEKKIARRGIDIVKIIQKLSNLKKEKLEISLAKLIEKSLHRLRILALKLENISTKRLQKIREKNKKIEEYQNEKIWDKIKKIKIRKGKAV